MAHKLTTCTFCGVGCGIYLETKDNNVTGAYPSMSHPANEGRICVRGWNVHEVASAQDRLKTPLIKREGKFEEASWDEAYSYIAERLSQIKSQYGPDAIGFLNSGRCSNEETYLLQKFARCVIGTRNVDHGTGIHRHNSIDVLQEQLGVPASTNSIADIAKTDVILINGVDLAKQLPTIGGWVIRAKLAGAKIIVIDPRKHRIAEHADYFLQLRPGTDTLLYGAMAKVIMDRALMDLDFIKAHCRDWEAFREKANEYDVLYAAEQCGVDAQVIEQAAVAFASADRAMILYSTGVEARGASSVESIANLALLTGNIGKEGAGVMSLAEQNNLQGICDMGMLPDMLPGYRNIEDAQARGELESLWGCKLPEKQGATARAMLTSLAGEQLKALWLDRHDAVITGVYCDAKSALEKLDFIVMQQLFMTETAQLADVVLPLTAYGEEEVTFTSTERRIQIAAQVKDPMPGTLTAWKQIEEVANRLGANWNYGSSAEVMAEISRVVPFYEGASYENLASDYGRQWPVTKNKPSGTRYLYEDGIQGQPFKFTAVSRPGVIPCATEDYPLSLMFGHSLYYWHRNVLILHSETLKREYRILLLDYPEGFVELNPDDARDLKVRDGQKVQLTSADGSASVAVRLTSEVKRGMIFVPYFLREVTQQLLGGKPCDEATLRGPVCVKLEMV